MNYAFLPPEDLYVFQCVGIQDKVSTVTGKDYKLLTLKISDGPYTGNVLFRVAVDTPRAQFVWDKWVDSLDEDDLIGKFAFARVKHESFGGSIRASVGQLITVPREVLTLGGLFGEEDA